MSPRNGQDSAQPTRVGQLRSNIFARVALLWIFAFGSLPATETRRTVEFGAPSITKVKGAGTKRHHHVSIPGLRTYGRPGEPALPRALVRVEIPEGEVVSRISVRPARSERIAGKYLVEPGRSEHSPIDGDGPESVRPIASIYSSKEPFPRESWRSLGTAYKQGRSIALIQLFPVTYRPISGRLDVTREFEVRVTTKTRPERLRLAKPGRIPEEQLTRNAGRLKNGTVALGAGGGGGLPPFGIPEGNVDYLVITSAGLAPSFEPLIAAREREGLASRIVSTDAIYRAYSGDRPDGGSDDATRIRNFVRDFYETRGLQFVLLAGDADRSADCDECEGVIVPVRYLQDEALFANPMPSDLYYSCLDGSFDHDGDGVYGEPNDGPDGGDVDLLAEVLVGRAPVDSVQEAENFVRKTLAYENSGGPVLRKVLLTGEFLGFGGDYDFGATLSEAIRTGSTDFIDSVGFENSPLSEFFQVSVLYDRDSRWTARVLERQLEDGVHIVNHVGHADISNVLKFRNREIDALDHGDYFFAYSQSCYAGAFDNERTDGSTADDSVVEHFVTGSAGAVAFVANSRRGWASHDVADGPSQRFNRVFWDVVLRRGVLKVSEANSRAKEELIGYVRENDRARACAYELNLFGDPALRLKVAGKRGSLSVDRDFGVTGTEMLLSVIDADLDLSSDEADTAVVRVESLRNGDTEDLSLTEAGLSAGVFQLEFVAELGEANPGNGTL
ncbi:MAG: C25 family cysteine peptidase, partial [Planctomycetota bacterium]